MFKLKTAYKITMIEGGDEGYGTYEIVDIALPLITIRNPNFGADKIVNTNSPNFVSAEITQENIAADYWTAGPKPFG